MKIRFKRLVPIGQEMFNELTNSEDVYFNDKEKYWFDQLALPYEKVKSIPFDPKKRQEYQRAVNDVLIEPVDNLFGLDHNFHTMDNKLYLMNTNNVFIKWFTSLKHGYLIEFVSDYYQYHFSVGNSVVLSTEEINDQTVDTFMVDIKENNLIVANLKK